jgi:hypothetical protein
MLSRQAFGVVGEVGQARRLAGGIDGGQRITQDFIATFCRSLKLNLPQQISFAVGLAQSPSPSVTQVRFMYTFVR